jgi:hypothetical protein
VVVGVIVLVEVVEEIVAMRRRIISSADRWFTRVQRDEGRRLHRSEVEFLGAALASQLVRRADGSPPLPPITPGG